MRCPHCNEEINETNAKPETRKGIDKRRLFEILSETGLSEDIVGLLVSTATIYQCLGEEEAQKNVFYFFNSTESKQKRLESVLLKFIEKEVEEPSGRAGILPQMAHELIELWQKISI